MLYTSDLSNDGFCRGIGRDIGIAGIDAHGSDVKSWPCENQFGHTPGLMLDSAETGNFYLDLIGTGFQQETV
jgi:hypothetical protein